MDFGKCSITGEKEKERERKRERERESKYESWNLGSVRVLIKIIKKQLTTEFTI